MASITWSSLQGRGYEPFAQLVHHLVMGHRDSIQRQPGQPGKPGFGLQDDGNQVEPVTALLIVPVSDHFRVMLVALILEKIRGKPHPQILRDDIITPLRLTHTIIGEEVPRGTDMIKGYVTIKG